MDAERFKYAQMQIAPISAESIQNVCRQCGGVCCTDKAFGDFDFRPYITEDIAKEIEITTGQNRNQFSDCLEGGESVLKRNGSGECIFFDEKTSSCKINSHKPYDCQNFPETNMAFPLARLILRMPVDLPECVLSQIMIGKAVTNENGSVQYALRGDQEYWSIVGQLAGFAPHEITNHIKQAVRDQILFRWSNPLKWSALLPKGAETIPLVQKS